MTLQVAKLAVVGVGLIGGSFALALRQAGAVGRVLGIGRGEANLRRALELGIIDAAGALDEATLADADLVIVAVPVGQMPRILRAVDQCAGPGTVITDAGSTKLDVVAVARRELRRTLERFVPAHPVAGTEKSGAQAAFADLYRNRNVVLTPLPETGAAALALVRSAWEACGARVLELPPDEHDAVFAAVSHLPHLLAYAMVGHVARHRNAGRLFSFAASGFRDFTRIASSHPEMWRDICMSNRVALLDELEAYGRELDRMRAVLRNGDAAGLEALLTEAREARERWLRGGGA